MKKLFVLSFAALVSYQAYSQESAISTAWDYLNTYQSEKSNGNDQSAIESLLAAKKEVDPVTSNPTTSGKSKAWKRKGEVYYYIFADQSPRLTLVKEGAVDTAINCFAKALTVEKKENGQPKIEDKDGVKGFLGSLSDTCFKIANIAYDNNDMEQFLAYLLRTKAAYDAFLTVDPKNEGVNKNLQIVRDNIIIASFRIGKDEYITKYVEPMVNNGTSSADGYGYLAQHYMSKGDKDKAMETIKKGKEKYADQKNIYLAEINLMLELNETDKAGTLIEEAKQKFASDKADFILAEVNFHLLKGNNEAAIKALDEAIAAYKGNNDVLKVLYFNTGVTYSQMYEKADGKEPKDTATMRLANNKMFEYYSKTVEVDPKYDPAYNGIANYYITNGNNLLLAADLIPLEKEAEYKALKAKANEEYLKAIDALEKAWAVRKQESYKRVLIALYEKTGQQDKKKAIEAQ